MKIRVTMPGQEPQEFAGVFINKAPLRLLERLKVETKFGMKALAAMEEEGDLQLAAVMAYLAMNRAGVKTNYDDLLDLSIDDIEMITEPGDPGYAEPEATEDPTSAPADSAPADDGGAPEQG